MESKQWGFLRETKEDAEKAGVDKDTGVCRTGLDEYLAVIFPNTHDWIHDKGGVEFDGKKLGTRPDYRSESLKMIVEFDGLPHYTNPDVILKDLQNTDNYEKAGYKVVRIPYFIQLSKDAVKELFSVDLDQELFDDSIPSLGLKGRNTPAYLCHEGVKRMAKEFLRFPHQYEINLKALKEANSSFLTGVDLLIQYAETSNSK